MNASNRPRRSVDRGLRGKSTRSSVPGSGRSGPSVVVVEAHDVVLAEVVALLDLDEDQRAVARVGDPVGGAQGDVDGLAHTELVVGAVEGHQGGAGDHEPV